jgi:hypothetical protein
MHSKAPKRFMNDLIIGTENGIRQLDMKIQNIYIFVASKKIIQILETNAKNVLHKDSSISYS